MEEQDVGHVEEDSVEHTRGVGGGLGGAYPMKQGR